MESSLVSTLNKLIETSNNGKLGFEKSAKLTHDPSLKSIFEKHAMSCSAAVEELRQAVINSGGEAQTGGTMAGMLHRGWTEMVAAVTGHDDHDILAECERGEDHAKEVYSKALEDNLPADIKAMIERQFASVKETHDEIRNLRDQYAASK